MAEPKFLYGSHYSTPGYVLYYLARVGKWMDGWTDGRTGGRTDRQTSQYDRYQLRGKHIAQFREKNEVIKDKSGTAAFGKYNIPLLLCGKKNG